MYNLNNRPFFDQLRSERERKIPEVKLEPINNRRPQVVGWSEFLSWAECNIPVWQYCSRLSDFHQLNSEQSFRLLSYYLVAQNRDLYYKLLDQETEKRIFIQQKPLTRWQKIKMLVKEIISL